MKRGVMQRLSTPPPFSLVLEQQGLQCCDSPDSPLEWLDASALGDSDSSVEDDACRAPPSDFRQAMQKAAAVVAKYFPEGVVASDGYAAPPPLSRG